MRAGAGAPPDRYRSRRKQKSWRHVERIGAAHAIARTSAPEI